MTIRATIATVLQRMANAAYQEALDAADYRDDYPADTLGHMRGQFWHDACLLRDRKSVV